MRAFCKERVIVASDGWPFDYALDYTDGTEKRRTEGEERGILSLPSTLNFQL